MIFFEHLSVDYAEECINIEISRLQRKEFEKMNYKSPDEIAAIIYDEMTPCDIHAVLDDCKSADDMIRYHNSVGRSIRNRFGFWEIKNPYTKGNHPDNVSHEILKKVWTIIVKNNPIPC